MSEDYRYKGYTLGELNNATCHAYDGLDTNGILRIMEVAEDLQKANAEITRQAAKIKDADKVITHQDGIIKYQAEMLDIHQSSGKEDEVKLAEQAQRIAELEFSLDDKLGINDDIASQLIVKDERIAELEKSARLDAGAITDQDRIIAALEDINTTQMQLIAELEALVPEQVYKVKFTSNRDCSKFVNARTPDEAREKVRKELEGYDVKFIN